MVAQISTDTFGGSFFAGGVYLIYIYICTHIHKHKHTHTHAHTHTHRDRETDGFRQREEVETAKSGGAGCCKLSKPSSCCYVNLNV